MRALQVTQASTALSIVFPCRPRRGRSRIVRNAARGGFPARSVTRAVTLTGLWNQFLNLSFPIVAVFLLALSGGETALLGVAAFVGAGVLRVVVAAFMVALISNGLAGDVGAVAARVANWSLGKVGRGPVSWGAASFERFRDDAGDLVRQRWHLLTSPRCSRASPSSPCCSSRCAPWTCRRRRSRQSRRSPRGRSSASSRPCRSRPAAWAWSALGLTAALVSFGGNNAGVVALDVVYRFAGGRP